MIKQTKFQDTLEGKSFVNNHKGVELSEMAEDLYACIYDWAKAGNQKVINIHFYPNSYSGTGIMVIHKDLR